MSIYVYDPNAEDFDCMGRVGALTPTKCEHDEVAGGKSELLLEHPLDARERFMALEPGCIIKAPVPVRTTPEIQNGQIVTSVESWTVKTTATKAERYLFTKAVKGKKKKLVPGGTKVTVVARGDERYKCKISKYGTGWMAIAALENRITETIPNDPSGIEQAEPAWSIQDQLFRIYEVERGNKGVTAKARHISYDLLGNLTTYEADNPTLGEALDGIMDNCLDDHEFEAKTNIASRRVDIMFVDENPVKALLDPEVGVLHRYGAELVRDDYELIFLNRAGINRGVAIEYGKNLLGVSCQTDFSDIATKILPYGENKDGERVYLSSDPDKPSKEITEASFISSGILGNYSFPRIYPLNVSDAKIDSKKGGKDVTPALACQRMREAAQDMFAAGADLPAINVKVEFLKLGDTAEYAQYKGLDDVFLYDTVRVRHKGIGIALNLDVVRVKFDCLNERCIEIELGTLREMMTSIASWQISSLNGSKITPFSLGGGSFQNEFISARLIQADTIQARHIQADTIEARHIQAEVISAEHINTALLVSEKIIAGICDIIQANIQKADIGEAHIDWAGITDLNAIYAEIANAEIGKANIGFAQIQDLVAGTAIIRQGVGGQLFIDRLAVTEANMVSLTTGELIIKGKDGHFYSLSVDDEGNVVSTLKQVSGGDVENHTLNAGEKIIEGTITAELLNVRQIFASDALIGAITAANIQVGTITPELVSSNFGETLDLSSNKAFQSIVNADVVREMIADGTRELRVTYDGAGTHMREDTDITTMTAYVYEGGKDVTDTVPDSAFLWTRESGDLEADMQWNTIHGTRQIIVTREDVNNRAIISCTLLSVGDMALTFEVDPLTMTLTVTNPEFGADSASYDPATGILTINGEGYTYDPETQTVTFSSGLSSARTTVQYTFSDETGIQTRILQLRDTIRLLVEDDQGGSTELRLTMGLIQALTDHFNVSGSLSIGAWNPVAKALLDEIKADGEKALEDALAAATAAAAAQGKALSAAEAAAIADQIARQTDNQILAWCKDGNRAYIDGGKIYAKSIKAAQIDVTDLYVHRIMEPSVMANSWLAPVNEPPSSGIPGGFGMTVFQNGSPTLRMASGDYGYMMPRPQASYYANGDGLAGIGMVLLRGNGDFQTPGGRTAQHAVCIKVPGPYDTLSGQIRGVVAEFYLSPTGNNVLYVPGNIYYGGSLTQTSDRRMKQDIRPSDEHELLMMLQCVRYRLIEHPEKLRMGIVAQDAQEVLGRLGIEDSALVDDENPDGLGASYTELVMPLVAGYQRHQHAIDAQAAQIAALEQENADLRARLERIEQMLGVGTNG